MPLTAKELLFVESTAHMADGDCDQPREPLLPTLTDVDPTVLIALAGAIARQGSWEGAQLVAEYAASEYAAGKLGGEEAAPSAEIVWDNQLKEARVVGNANAMRSDSNPFPF